MYVLRIYEYVCMYVCLIRTLLLQLSLVDGAHILMGKKVEKDRIT